MTNKNKKILRILIDVLMILPASVIAIPVILGALGVRSNDLVIATFAIVVLIVGLMFKKWLKPQSIQELIDSLYQEGFYLNNRIKESENWLITLEKHDQQSPGSRQTEIETHQLSIKANQDRLMKIQERIKELKSK